MECVSLQSFSSVFCINVLISLVRDQTLNPPFFCCRRRMLHLSYPLYELRQLFQRFLREEV